MGTLATALVLGLVSATLIQTGRSLFRGGGSDYRFVLSHVRWWMVPLAAGHAFVLVVAVVVLLQVPGLGWGWYQYATGTTGNAMLGQSDRPGALFAAAAIVIPLVIMGLIPLLAYAEEVAFRAGAESRTPVGRVRVAVTFGLVHCLMGVPLAVGIALVISGAVYDRVYVRSHRARSRRVWAAVQDRIAIDDLRNEAAEAPEQAVSGDPDALVRYDASSDTWVGVGDSPRRYAIGVTAATHAVQNWVLLTPFTLSIVLTPWF